MTLTNVYLAMVELDKVMVHLSDGCHTQLVERLADIYDLLNDEYCEALSIAKDVKEEQLKLS